MFIYEKSVIIYVKYRNEMVVVVIVFFIIFLMSGKIEREGV